MGDVITIDQGTSDVLQGLETLSDGRVVVTYLSGSPNDLGLKFQILDPRGPDIVGTGLADVLVAGTSDWRVTGPRESVIRGMGGDDSLTEMRAQTPARSSRQ